MAALEPGGTGRVSIVVLTHRRAQSLLRCLEHLVALPERPALVVVDNGSRDGSAQRVRERFPDVTLVELDENLGAAGRNAGVARVHTPFVAFCDDDAWWAPGALGRAVDLLQSHPSLGAVAARVLVGPDNCPDPVCDAMAASPLPRGSLPGPALAGFTAGATVMRTAAFRQAGGYEPRLQLGGEEALLALDLLAAGWRIAHARELVLHHHPAPLHDPAQRRLILARNRLWVGWLRLSPALAWYQTCQALREARAEGIAWRVVVAALRGWRWVAARRHVAPRAVQAQFALVHGGPARTQHPHPSPLAQAGEGASAPAPVAQPRRTA